MSEPVELVDFVRKDSVDPPYVSEDAVSNGDVTMENDHGERLELVRLESEDGSAGPPQYSLHFSTKVAPDHDTSDGETANLLQTVIDKRSYMNSAVFYMF